MTHMKFTVRVNDMLIESDVEMNMTDGRCLYRIYGHLWAWPDGRLHRTDGYLNNMDVRLTG